MAKFMQTGAWYWLEIVNKRGGGGKGFHKNKSYFPRKKLYPTVAGNIADKYCWRGQNLGHGSSTWICLHCGGDKEVRKNRVWCKKTAEKCAVLYNPSLQMSYFLARSMWRLSSKLYRDFLTHVLLSFLVQIFCSFRLSAIFLLFSQKRETKREKKELERGRKWSLMHITKDEHR